MIERAEGDASETSLPALLEQLNDKNSEVVEQAMSAIDLFCEYLENKINIYLGNPEVSYYDALNKYYEHYKLKELKKNDERKNKQKYVFGSLLLIILFLIIYLYIK